MKKQLQNYKDKICFTVVLLFITQSVLFANNIDTNKICEQMDMLLNKKEYQDAIKLGKRNLSKLKKNSLDYAQVLFRMAKSHVGIQNYTQAEKLFKKSMDIAENYGNESIRLQSEIAIELSDYYLMIDPYKHAIDYLTDVALEKQINVIEDIHQQIDKLLNDTTYTKQKDLEKLFSELEYVGWLLEYHYAKNTTKHPYITNADDVTKFCTELRAQTSKLFGEISKESAQINLACGEHQEGKAQFEEAFKYYNQSLEVYRQLYGEQSLEYARLNYHIGKVEAYLGDTETALKKLQETIAIHEMNKIYDNIYISTLEAMGAIHTIENRYHDAIAYLKKAEGHTTKLFGAKSSHSFRIKVKMTEIMIYTGEMEKARGMLDEIDNAYDYAFDGFNIEDTNEGMYLEALLFMKQNQYAHARIILQALMEVIDEVYQKQNQEKTIKIYNDMGYCSYRTGQYDEAFTYYRNYLDLTKQYAHNIFVFMPETKREHYWKIQSKYLEKLLCTNHTTTIFDPSTDQQIVSVESWDNLSALLYDAALLQKGTLLEASKNMFSAIENSENTQLQHKLRRLQEIQQIFSNLAYQKNGNNSKINKKELQLEADRLEKELIEQSRQYSEYMTYLNIGWQDVQKSLGENDVAIEFVCSSENGRKYYSAEILRKEFAIPKHVVLFSVEENTPLAFNMNKTDRFLWPKILPYLNENDNVYFAASGDLHKHGIEYFLINNQVRMDDKYNMYRVSSTRELTLNDPVTHNKDITLYGGMDYNLGIEEMAYYSEISKYRGKKERINQKTIKSKHLWGYLPGTANEVLNITPILEEKGYQTKTYLAEESIEENFKIQSENSSSIIHIATHGFYEPEESKNEILLSDFQISTEDESLLYSGLIFSGANHAWLGNTDLGNMDDGILTAKEIASMNLQSTDLVVLSACQTGQGKITGEGVFGLQRAFKKAGVGTILMTLWEVNDDVTQLLMTSFYDHYTQGMSKHEALKAAQEEIKKKEFINEKGIKVSGNNPQLWGAFILLD